MDFKRFFITTKEKKNYTGDEDEQGGCFGGKERERRHLYAKKDKSVE